MIVSRQPAGHRAEYSWFLKWFGVMWAHLPCSESAVTATGVTRIMAACVPMAGCSLLQDLCSPPVVRFGRWCLADYVALICAAWVVPGESQLMRLPLPPGRDSWTQHVVQTAQYTVAQDSGLPRCSPPDVCVVSGPERVVVAGATVRAVLACVP